LDNTSVYGTQGQFDLWYVDGTQYGFLNEVVLIPTTKKGDVAVFANGYAHPYVEGVIKAILEFIGISFESGWAMKHSWRTNFEIGTTKAY
jgi:hypothetical protein